MSDQTRALYEAVTGSFSIWDAAHIFEYATSRFTAIHLAQLAEPNPSSSYKYSFAQHLVWEVEHFVIPFVSMCAVMNINTSMPVYLSHVLIHITTFQTEHDNRRTLFERFRNCPHDESGDAACQYRVVPRYHHCWWTTAFHFQNIQMPLQFSVAEVKALAAAHFKQWASLLIPELITHPRKDDPLLQQLHALRTEVARLGLDLGQMLVNEVYDAMAASHAAVEVLAEDYNNGRIGTSPCGDPFPEMPPFMRR
ncbi:uncharacterized protein F5147DRAFT_781846 [Suillus discolor]|uniref:Uncharacterized protein n=1 Tax=Suillus discolor TaxID=1912936 RepID=A0A9P7ESL0_9AGAM|nr:uncharacterized protein F5147DRAFT_781846 [Suillus discolor]KAG2085887.1 hypothetical protein F5147DRAFT_781846 [Suillus discolor]